MTKHDIQKEPHTFATLKEAVAALSGFIDAEAAERQYEIRVVHGMIQGELVVDGYQVRAMDLDGFGVGYVAPQEAA